MWFTKCQKSSRFKLKILIGKFKLNFITFFNILKIQPEITLSEILWKSFVFYGTCILYSVDNNCMCLKNSLLFFCDICNTNFMNFCTFSHADKVHCVTTRKKILWVPELTKFSLMKKHAGDKVKIVQILKRR